MRQQDGTWTLIDYVLVTLTLGFMGAFYWAIRGSSGYGGETGGMLAGVGWALLWCAFSQRGAGAACRPYGRPWILLAITLGIAFGGFTGYGVYIGWLNGRFYLNYPEGLRDVSAWTGYAMLFLCGLHWGGNTGCFMAWCAPKRPLSGFDWGVRILCGFAGAVAAWGLVRLFPQCFLPFYAEGIYSVPEYATCQRALDSVQTVAIHVGLVLGFLGYELARGDRRAVALIAVMGLGFAIPFTAGGYWQTAPFPAVEIDWWKCWEMSIGLGGGLAFGVAFWLFNRPGNIQQGPLGRKSRAFFRSGFFLWFASVNVLQGAYDGWCGIHDVEKNATGYLVLVLASLVPLLAAWFWRTRRGLAGEEAPVAPLVAPGLVLVLQGLIILCGLLVSYPRQWAFGNTFLWCLYGGYFLVSGAAAGAFYLRRRTAGR